MVISIWDMLPRFESGLLEVFSSPKRIVRSSPFPTKKPCYLLLSTSLVHFTSELTHCGIDLLEIEFHNWVFRSGAQIPSRNCRNRDGLNCAISSSLSVGLIFANHGFGQERIPIHSCTYRRFQSWGRRQRSGRQRWHSSKISESHLCVLNLDVLYLVMITSSISLGGILLSR